MTRSHIAHNLEQKISQLVKSNNTIKILKKGNAVFVNGETIVSQYGLHVVKNHNPVFLVKKSAVAYAICIATKDDSLAKTIVQLDHTYRKLTEDALRYSYTMKNASNQISQETAANSLSAIKPRLSNVRDELTQTLKSIKIA